MKFNSRSELETIDFGINFSKKIKKGSVLSLIGNLGSGKTVFAKGFAKGLKIKEHVASPTFKIISEYIGDPHDLYHIDSYRLNDSKDFLKIGGEEFLNQNTGVTLIEWGNLINDILPEHTIKIIFRRMDNNHDRQIEIQEIKS